MCLFNYRRKVVRVTFCAVSSVPQNFKNSFGSKSEFTKTQRKMVFHDLGLSLGVGLTVSSLAAGVIRYKRIPNVIANSLEIGSVCSYLAYMGTLISTPFRAKSVKSVL